jgi:hypothetical protein
VPYCFVPTQRVDRAGPRGGIECGGRTATASVDPRDDERRAFLFSLAFVFLGFLSIAAVKVPRGTDPTIQIFNDDVVAFTRLFDLMLLIPATFPYLSDRRLGDAEANHADGNCHSSECESDTAQSRLPRSQVKSL